MSVAAIVTLKPGIVPPPGFPASGYLPVATEAQFVSYWLPIATSAKLSLIAEFGSGVVIPPAEISEVDSELEVFAALAPAALPRPEAEHRRTRSTIAQSPARARSGHRRRDIHRLTQRL